MIFVTVGHQMPFDRLVHAMDEWAAAAGRSDVVAQIGRGTYRPAALQALAFMTPEEFAARMDEAEMIVGHAGTGTIIAALSRGKPLLVLPRLSALGETRNDHQIPTARHFAERGYVLAAADAADIPERMKELAGFRPRGTIGRDASPELIDRLKSFIASGEARGAPQSQAATTGAEPGAVAGRGRGP